jgi:hypothetical protein
MDNTNDLYCQAVMRHVGLKPEIIETIIEFLKTHMS